MDEKGAESAGCGQQRRNVLNLLKHIIDRERQGSRSHGVYRQPTSSTTSTMTPSRRSRLASNGPAKRSKPAPMSPPSNTCFQSESSPSHSPASKPPQPQTQSAMTADARYQKNLKSLRRIDPTILSIVDQFSHICLYRLHEGKWLKDGFEGASFLFERCVCDPVIFIRLFSSLPCII